MCFTPLVSIGTAAIEFSIAAYLKKIIKDPRLRLAPVFVFLLGFYQFTEFMLCKTGNAEIWSRLGFVTYTFMPMVFAHFVLNVSDKRMEKVFYAIPILFSLIAILHPNFVIYSSCNLLHITSINVLYDQYQYLTVIYLIYYAFFPAIALYFFAREYKNGFLKRIKFGIIWSLVSLTLLFAHLFVIFWGVRELDMEISWLTISAILFVVGMIIFVLAITSSYEKRLFLYLNLVVFSSAGIAVPVLFFFLPVIGYNFPSIFCQFAFLYSIAILIFVGVFQNDSKIRSAKSN